LVTVFDCDGVLVDSRAAVEKAYREAGVQPPDDFWGKPWQEWLPQACKGIYDAMWYHKRKNEIYLNLIQRGAVPLLSGGEVFREMLDQGATLIVATSGSMQAIQAVMRYHKLKPAATYYELRSEQRVSLLERIAMDYLERCVYVDDNPTFNEPMRVIRYDATMTKDELTEAIGWTP
jgi:phosphoglycolate phosphatase-like HAD superfamily hydrolase